MVDDSFHYFKADASKLMGLIIEVQFIPLCYGGFQQGLKKKHWKTSTRSFKPVKFAIDMVTKITTRWNIDLTVILQNLQVLTIAYLKYSIFVVFSSFILRFKILNKVRLFVRVINMI